MNVLEGLRRLFSGTTASPFRLAKPKHRRCGVWYTYGIDLTKNVCEVFGSTDYIATALTYTPYGSVTATGNLEQPIQWSSEFYDSELALVYYNYRHYNPKEGKWIRRDKIVLTTQSNLYTMTHNNTVRYWDRLGLYVVLCFSYQEGTITGFRKMEDSSKIEKLNPETGKYECRGGFNLHTGCASNGCVTIESEIEDDTDPEYPQSSEYDRLNEFINQAASSPLRNPRNRKQNFLGILLVEKCQKDCEKSLKAYKRKLLSLLMIFFFFMGSMGQADTVVYAGPRF